MPAGDLPIVEFAFPGPLRDQLVAAILAGEKTTTTSLVADYDPAQLTRIFAVHWTLRSWQQPCRRGRGSAVLFVLSVC